MVMCLRMRASALRVTVVALGSIAFAAAAAFLFNTERQIAASTAAMRAFDRQARDASAALADVRASGQAYVGGRRGSVHDLRRAAARADSPSGADRGLRRREGGSRRPLNARVEPAERGALQHPAIHVGGTGHAHGSGSGD